MIIGLAMDVPPAAVNLVYTVTVFEFGLLYWYQNTHSRAAPVVEGAPEPSKIVLVLLFLLMALFGIAGGFVTANVGSGSDIALYAFGVFVWNKVVPGKALGDNQLTASSVVVMGAMSALTSLARALAPTGEGFTERTVQVQQLARSDATFGT